MNHNETIKQIIFKNSLMFIGKRNTDIWNSKVNFGRSNVSKTTDPTCSLKQTKLFYGDKFSFVLQLVLKLLFDTQILYHKTDNF